MGILDKCALYVMNSVLRYDGRQRNNKAVMRATGKQTTHTYLLAQNQNKPYTIFKIHLQGRQQYCITLTLQSWAWLPDP